MAHLDGLVHVLALDHLLGRGAFHMACSAEGQRKDISYRCGCLATERELDRYEIVPCAKHRALITKTA